MKLYFKQKVFSFRQRSEIFDENGNVVFTALGELISLGRKMHIYDSSSNEVAFVQQRLMRLFSEILVIYKRSVCGRYRQGILLLQAQLPHRGP